MAETSDADETRRFLKRNSPRVPANGEFVLLYVTAEDNADVSDADDALFFYAKVVNISEGGLRLKLPLDENREIFDVLPLPEIDQTVELYITGPSLPRPIRLDGTVVSLSSDASDRAPQLSIRFHEIPEYKRGAIQVGLLRLRMALEAKQDDPIR